MTQLAARCSCITVTWFQNKRRFPNNRPIKKNAGKKQWKKATLNPRDCTGSSSFLLLNSQQLGGAETAQQLWHQHERDWRQIAHLEDHLFSARPQQTFHYPVYGPGSLEYHKLLSKKCLWKSVGYFGIWNMICLSPIHPNLVAHHLAMGP